MLRNTECWVFRSVASADAIVWLLAAGPITRISADTGDMICIGTLPQRPLQGVARARDTYLFFNLSILGLLSSPFFFGI